MLLGECFLELIDRVRLEKVRVADSMAWSRSDKMLVCKRLALHTTSQCYIYSYLAGDDKLTKNAPATADSTIS
jgi:hypothetical protein